MVRCKMIVSEIIDRFNSYKAGGEKETSVVKLCAVAGEENKTWSKWTPSGHIELHINNPAALEQFRGGQCYFVDFSPAPAKESDEGK